MNFTCNTVCTQISEGDIFKGGPPADAIVSKMTAFCIIDHVHAA